MYAVDVSPDLISTVTDAVLSEVTAWQARPLETMYPVVFFDALRVKIRDEAVVQTKAVYLALAVLPDGTRDILGVWIEQSEGAKFWMKVFADLQARGCRDILIAVTDGLKGMPDALAAVYPATTLQTCLVHLIRHSLDFATWKTRKPLAAAHLHRAQCRGRRRGARRIRRRPVGHPLADRRRVLAPGVGAGGALLCVSAGHSACALHDERAGKRQSPVAQDAQDPRAVSDR
jgi:putative transposase